MLFHVADSLVQLASSLEAKSCLNGAESTVNGKGNSRMLYR